MRVKSGFGAIATVVVTAFALAAFAAGPLPRQAHAQGSCANPTDPVALTSVEQVAGLMTGTWILCDGPPLFGDGSNGEVGIQVVDGRFHRVYRVSDGSLIRADGLDQEGILTILDTTDMNGPGIYQANWTLLGQGTTQSFPTIYQSPPVLAVGAQGTSHYEPWVGPAPTPAPPPGGGIGSCGNPTQPITLTAVELVQDLLVGAWTRCGTGSAIGDPTDEAGLEFSPDGRFQRLVRAADGTVASGSGPGNGGAWTVIDTTGMNGPGSYQVDLTVDGSGTRITFSVFLAAPSAVRFVGMTGAAYLRGRPADGVPPPEPTAPQAPTTLPPTGIGTSGVVFLSAVVVTLLGLALRAVTRVRRRGEERRGQIERPASFQYSSLSNRL